jgi:hypothetical protein
LYRKDGNSYSAGMLIYVSDKLISKRLDDLETFCEESVWVELRKSQEEY